MAKIRSAGFTLIEVLVVVAIIALLVSILLPSLNQAREQAKVVKCIANHKSLGTASAAYMTSNKNRFPWAPAYHQVTSNWSNAYTTKPYSHYYGGKRGIGDPPAGPLHNYYKQNTEYDFYASERPLNRYVVSAKLGKDADLPVYSCPAEKPPVNGGLASRSNYLLARSNTSAYDMCGTSYAANVTWYVYVNRVELPADPEKRIARLMDRIISIYEKLGPSRGILLHEDPSDCLLGGVLTNYPQDYMLKGWHGKPRMFTMSFVDGHAGYVNTVAKMNLDHKGGLNSFTECSASQAKDPKSGCTQGTSTWVARQNYMQE